MTKAMDWDDSSIKKPIVGSFYIALGVYLWNPN